MIEDANILYIFTVVLILLIIVKCKCDHSKESKGNFCLYDHPYYYPSYQGKKARDYNTECVSYCSGPSCMVWCGIPP